MVYFMSYWSHLDISTTICPHQMAAVGFETMTLGFLRLGPLLTVPSMQTHCAISEDLLYTKSKSSFPNEIQDYVSSYIINNSFKIATEKY